MISLKVEQPGAGPSFGGQLDSYREPEYDVSDSDDDDVPIILGPGGDAEFEPPVLNLAPYYKEDPTLQSALDDVTEHKNSPKVLQIAKPPISQFDQHSFQQEMRARKDPGGDAGFEPEIAPQPLYVRPPSELNDG